MPGGRLRSQLLITSRCSAAAGRASGRAAPDQPQLRGMSAFLKQRTTPGIELVAPTRVRVRGKPHRSFPLPALCGCGSPTRPPQSSPRPRVRQYPRVSDSSHSFSSRFSAERNYHDTRRCLLQLSVPFSRALPPRAGPQEQAIPARRSPLPPAFPTRVGLRLPRSQ